MIALAVTTSSGPEAPEEEECWNSGVEPKRCDLQQDETTETQAEEAITSPVFPRLLYGQPSSRASASP